MGDYPASSLIENKGKHYVLVTIPKELRSEFGGRTQLKRSTGTSDKSEAKRRQHSITSSIYAEFDRAKPNPLDDLSSLINFPPNIVEKIVEQAEDGKEITLSDGDMKTLRQVAEVQRLSADRYVGQRRDGSFIPSDKPQKAREALTILDELSPAITVSRAAEEYFESEPYDKVKTENDARKSIGQFQDFTGDIPLNEITHLTGHQWTESLHSDGIARKTITKKLSYVKVLLDWCARNGTLPFNPLAGFKIGPKIGAPREHYVPFSNDELHEIFSLSMPDHLRTLLSILITTGMRLDEAALLDWDNIKDDHFDLTEAIVKTKGSRRKVPIPTVIRPLFKDRGTGQLFPQFKRDKDGKAQSPASKALMKQIRKVTTDRQKVVHSLRGNLKDLLRDAGVAEDINNFITGHGSGDVAGKYGIGPSLEVRRKALDSVDHPWLH